MTITDTLDQCILKKLREKSQSTTALAIALQCKRTTVQYRLKRLRAAAHVRVQKQGRETCWEITKKNTQGRGLVRTYQNKEINQVLELIAQVPRHSIIYGIQGYAALAEELRWIPIAALKKYHATLKRRRIKIIACQSRRTLESLPSLSTELLHSHLGRAVGTNLLLAPHSLLGNGVVLVTPTYLVCTNTKSRRAVVITDKVIVQTLYESYVMLFQTISELDATKTIDLNEHIRQELRQRGELA